MKSIKDRKKHLRRFESDDIVNAFKMMGNGYRMDILNILSKNPGLSLDQINQHVGGDIKNIHAHTKKLHMAGLIHKKNKGVAVQHILSSYGQYSTQAYKLFTKDPYL
jgi:predicted transcriptional regulator